MYIFTWLYWIYIPTFHYLYLYYKSYVIGGPIAIILGNTGQFQTPWIFFWIWYWLTKQTTYFFTSVFRELLRLNYNSTLSDHHIIKWLKKCFSSLGPNIVISDQVPGYKVCFSFRTSAVLSFRYMKNKLCLLCYLAVAKYVISFIFLNTPFQSYRFSAFFMKHPG